MEILNRGLGSIKNSGFKAVLKLFMPFKLFFDSLELESRQDLGQLLFV